MKKNILIILLIGLISLTSCSELGVGTTYNNIVNKTVSYENITISDFNGMTEEAVEKASISNVAVISEKSGILTNKRKLGSGVIIKRVEKTGFYTYYILTNRHVIEDEGTIYPKFSIIYNGDEADAQSASLITYDLVNDIALLEWNSSVLLEPVTIGDSSNLKKGSFIIAYGNPYSLDFFGTASFGIISAPRRMIVDEVYNSTQTTNNYYIQHDAAINSGNSGGGLFDIYGNLIGINTLKLIGTSSDEIDGISFAIPVHIIAQLARFRNYF